MDTGKVKDKKVYVALSGGVDSSVSAALLKEAGYDVTGVFIKVWQPDFLECTWPAELEDAMRVSAKLEIPFKTYDFEEEYKREVVDYMISEYQSGRTPNPDVVCNTKIKFDAFFNRARSEGADFIATGHYVEQHTKEGAHELISGADSNKDQSYFLWGLSQDVLRYTLFPVGKYQKSKVRSLAKRFGLKTATKKDSQGLCFLGKLDMREFLKHFIKEKVGKVLTEDGIVIGEHEGAFFYTIGQRHGFTLTTPVSNPHYVISKDLEENTITVSKSNPEERRMEGVEKISLSGTNWIGGESPKQNVSLMVRSRYRQELFEATLVEVDSTKTMLAFTSLRPGLASGQSMVMYEKLDDRGRYKMLGGGVILGGDK